MLVCDFCSIRYGGPIFHEKWQCKGGKLPPKLGVPGVYHSWTTPLPVLFCTWYHSNQMFHLLTLNKSCDLLALYHGFPYGWYLFHIGFGLLCVCSLCLLEYSGFAVHLWITFQPPICRLLLLTHVRVCYLKQVLEVPSGIFGYYYLCWIDLWSFPWS